MKKAISELNIGKYIATIDEDGTLQVRALDMRDPLILDAGQAESLFTWLSEMRGQPAQPATPAAAPQTTPAPTPQPEPTPEPEQNPQEIVLAVIRTNIVVARDQYPASLGAENRDRFIEQIARNPTVRPLMSQGKVNRRQLTLWIEQEMELNAPPKGVGSKKRK